MKLENCERCKIPFKCHLCARDGWGCLDSIHCCRYHTVMCESITLKPIRPLQWVLTLEGKNEKISLKDVNEESKS